MRTEFQIVTHVKKLKKLKRALCFIKWLTLHLNTIKHHFPLRIKSPILNSKYSSKFIERKWQRYFMKQLPYLLAAISRMCNLHLTGVLGGSKIIIIIKMKIKTLYLCAAHSPILAMKLLHSLSLHLTCKICYFIKSKLVSP